MAKLGMFHAPKGMFYSKEPMSLCFQIPYLKFMLVSIPRKRKPQEVNEIKLK